MFFDTLNSGFLRLEHMKKRKNITVLGGGSFGTVLANLAAKNGNDVCLYVRNVSDAKSINDNHINPRYLPEFILEPNLRANTDLQASVENVDLIFIAIPSRHCREVMQAAAPYISDTCMLVSLTKGIEAGSLKLMSEVIHEELPECPFGVLSGPNLAKQIAASEVAGTVVASSSQRLLALVRKTLRSPDFRVFVGQDVFGVELGGALKNIYAIIFGMARELSIGENTQALLFTRALAEMSRFAAVIGANPSTFIGLAGVGDLFATCMSPQSRNFQVGQALAQGKSLDDIIANLGQVAEGVNTLRQVKAKADAENITMPLVNALYDLVVNNHSLDDVITAMNSIPENRDVEFAWNP